MLLAPGVGKTHLAVALGLNACEHGVRVLFTTPTGLIATLGKALAEGRLDERLKSLAQPQLLMIDEIGYIPLDRQGATLFFSVLCSSRLPVVFRVAIKPERQQVVAAAVDAVPLTPLHQRAAGSRKFTVDLPANRLGPGLKRQAG